jgi:HD superfamily phosphohydrolase
VHHEEISLLIFEQLNKEFDGTLDTALNIFKGTHPKTFLHQLISSQLDVDRMDYLTRDSFYSGVNEGVIGYDRIIKMMTVHNNEIVIEEKGVYSVEKFLVARRLMYWQAYLHKTVLSAENMLVKILERARILANQNSAAFSASPVLDEFLRTSDSASFIRDNLVKFCALDDYDVLSSIKQWSLHSDKILSTLSNMLINRNMLKTRLQMQPISSTEKEKLQAKAAEWLGVSVNEASFLVFDGIAENRMYNTKNERINILFKDGTIKDISQVEYGLIHLTGSSPAQKFYLCAPGEILKKAVQES